MKLTPEEREHILSRRAIAKQREADRLELQAMLDHALSLPFDQALPIVRKCLNTDYKLIWTDPLAKWCTANSKAIEVIMKGKP